MLCPSCRRQLERGASYCGSCGTPLNGAAAPLELVLGGRDARAGRDRDDDRARARARRWCSTDPSVSRVHARISGRRGARGRRLLARDVARRRAGDRARRRCTTARRSGSATPSCASSAGATSAEAGRTIVVRAGASLLVPSVGAPACRARRRSSGCSRGCARATRSSAWTRPRAPSAGCCRTSTRGTFLRLSRQRRGAVRAARRHARRWSSWSGCAEQRFGADRAGAAGAAAVRPRRARLPGRRGGRAQAARAGADARLARLFKPREKIFPGVGPVIEALYRRGGWVLFTRPALIVARGADRRRASRRSST